MITSWRIRFLVGFFVISILLVVGRLFYWQIVLSEKLATSAKNQRELLQKITPLRGEILAKDGFSLVSNQETFLLFANPNRIDQKKEEIARKLVPFLLPSNEELSLASLSAKKNQKELVKQVEKDLEKKFENSHLFWVALKNKIPLEKKEKIEKLAIDCLGFEKETIRIYPEASMAAHLLGFVGSNLAGEQTGYFGVEGYYDLQLKGKTGIVKGERTADDEPILIGSFFSQKKKDGRSLKLHLDRSIQFMIEEALREGLQKYGAAAGSVLVLDPKNGAVLAMASFSSYNPFYYWYFNEEKFKNPQIAETYEPGSTFKVLTMAAALEEGVVKPETRCEICDRPFKIDKYLIKTWNEKYYPDSTMSEVLQHSDNIGMVFVGRRLGIEKFRQYFKNFGLGEKTGIDLQEEVSGLLRDKDLWGEVDLTTASFGQGIAVTAIQMASAVSALANGGILYQPQVVAEILGEKEIKIKPRMIRKVISEETAKTITAMMVSAVEQGEAKWAKPAGYRIAGKTGTAQIPVAGHYDTEKTIASFVGFAPADNPKFLILVKLREPTSSPWGSETAAPLFFKIAKKLFIYYGIPPEE